MTAQAEEEGPPAPEHTHGGRGGSLAEILPRAQGDSWDTKCNSGYLKFPVWNEWDSEVKQILLIPDKTKTSQVVLGSILREKP